MTPPSARIEVSGAPLARAKAAMILLHGRGATAAGMLELGEVLAQPDVAYIAPEAPGHTWYPNRFLAPIAHNEPHLSNALATVDGLVRELGRKGFGPEKIVLLGFSQGGCLALEYAARNAQRYGAVIGLSAGLIGPDGLERNDKGSLQGTRVVLGCSEADAHIPVHRVRETSRILKALGGDVVERIYPGSAHSINDDEIAQVRAALVAILHPETN
jgi:phospholipase/carboxylesterase